MMAQRVFLKVVAPRETLSTQVTLMFPLTIVGPEVAVSTPDCL